MKLIRIQEHDELEDAILKILENNKKHSCKLLQIDNKNNTIPKRASYKIGYCWLNDETSLYIAPKEYDKKRANFHKMFAECLEDEEIAKKINSDKGKENSGVYKIFLDEKPIEVKSKDDDISLFLIMHFLKLTEQIVKKGLKRGYVYTTENLSSKIKGKILVKDTLRKNHFKNQMNKTVCSFYNFTLDCLENRILKLALYKVKSYLNRYDLINKLNLEKIWDQLGYNIRAFELVSLTDIKIEDFKKIKHSPFYQEYKQALDLAYLIFKRFGFSLHHNDKEFERNFVYPFYIDMSKLFEFYVWLKLKKDSNKILAQAKISIEECKELEMETIIPDFLLPNEKSIVDAKYKYWDNNKISKKDLSQLTLYGRSKKIRDKLNLEANEIPKLCFVYPTFNKGYEDIDCEKVKENNCFEELYKIPLTIPYISDNKSK